MSLADFSVPVKLVKWIIKYIDPMLCQFKFKNRVITFDRELVRRILGLGRGTRPVRVSGNSNSTKELREVYLEGERAKISKCMDLLTRSKDKESFMRGFMLLALGTLFCPGTGNYVEMKYLHSLGDISELSSYDWAGHVLGEVMDEVKKYQKYSAEWLERDHQIRSCLIILAVGFCLDSPFYIFPYIDTVSNLFYVLMQYRLPTWISWTCHKLSLGVIKSTTTSHESATSQTQILSLL